MERPRAADKVRVRKFAQRRGAPTARTRVRIRDKRHQNFKDRRGARVLTTMRILFAGALALVSIGCAAKPAAPPLVPTAPSAPVTAPERDAFAAALDAFAAHDRSATWSPVVCDEMHAKLSASARAEAKYDAGLVALRCGRDTDAEADFKAALAAKPDFRAARVELAMVTLAIAVAKDPTSERAALDAAIDEIDAVVKGARYQDTAALVRLARLQHRRGTLLGSAGQASLEQAKASLQRALAIDDSSMPAYAELALVELDFSRARKEATGKVDGQQLDLAALVCSQAIKRDAGFAPIHYAAGLIEAERGDATAAVRELDLARKLDPTLLGAHAEAGSINLRFRGFERAEEAYRKVIALSPKDYDAHLGLAVALRGEINDENFTAKVADATDALHAAQRIAPDRAEAYYDEAILTLEHKARTADGARELEHSKKLFQTFIDKAGARFAEERAKAKERIDDINKMTEFEKK